MLTAWESEVAGLLYEDEVIDEDEVYGEAAAATAATADEVAWSNEEKKLAEPMSSRYCRAAATEADITYDGSEVDEVTAT